jgi:hypothetical protein
MRRAQRRVGHVALNWQAPYVRSALFASRAQPPVDVAHQAPHHWQRTLFASQGPDLTHIFFVDHSGRASLTEKMRERFFPVSRLHRLRFVHRRNNRCLDRNCALSTALAYILYFRILARVGATNLLTVTFLIPISAIALGFAFLGETPRLRHLAGLACIGCGLAAIDGRVWRALSAKPVTGE